MRYTKLKTVWNEEQCIGLMGEGWHLVSASHGSKSEWIYLMGWENVMLEAGRAVKHTCGSENETSSDWCQACG